MIGKRIKELRKFLGLSQTKFAQILKNTRNTIGNWESGNTTPDESTIELLCLRFKINKSWLLTGTGDMFGHEKHVDNSYNGDFGVQIHSAGEVNYNGVASKTPIADYMQDDVIELNQLIAEYGTPKIVKQFINKMLEIKKLHEED